MMRRLFILLLLLVAGCSGDPPARVPPLRAATEGAHRAALVSAHNLRWNNAIESWREALAGYQAMDDWSGQGTARLGLAHAYVRHGRADLAEIALSGMSEQKLFSPPLRAHARYQQALLQLPGKPALAQSQLDEAIVLCGKDCKLTAQFNNLAARLAAGRNDWLAVSAHAGKALAAAQENPAERAHARRLLAEAALAQAQPVVARAHMESALIDDRQLADPDWLLEDYLVLARIAAATNDTALAVEARVRQKSLCSAASLPACQRQNP